MSTIYDIDQKLVINLNPRENSKIDLEAVIEQIWKDLGGSASRADVRREVFDVFPRFENARIMSYVPIFLTKEVRSRLLLGSMGAIQTTKIATDIGDPNQNRKGRKP